MKAPKILVYCGIHRCESFGLLVPRFDSCYGFEADPELAEAARARFKGFPNVNIVHAALGETNGPVTLNIHDSAAATSVGRLGDAYRTATGNKIHPVGQITVPGINLYEYLVSRNVEYIDLYQSDIQGMDFAVLRTLAPMIERRAIRVISCETERDDHTFQSYEGLPSNKQARFMGLLDTNYRIVEMQKVMPNWMHQDVTWRLRFPNSLLWPLRRAGLFRFSETKDSRPPA